MFIFQESEIFSDSRKWSNFGRYSKIAHKVAKSKYFFKYLNTILICAKFSFQRCIISLCYINFSEMNGRRGGGGGGCLVLCN